MNKSSVAKVLPAAMDRATTATGSCLVNSETIVVNTTARVEFIDLTDRIIAYGTRSGVQEGLIGVWSTHTTCALFVNEYQDALLSDLGQFLEQFVPRDSPYRHNDLNFSDCDRQNADAHLRATMLSHSLMLPISGGEVVVGRWQRLLMAELDGPRARALRVQIVGVR